DVPSVARVLFNHLALSPYTSLVENLLAFLRAGERDVAMDVLGYMLRHLARHLNAFDLVKFHNLGANYPDALMLDALLRAFITLIDDAPPRALSSIHRRALRQGWVARKRCEGLRVPDAPTSPGENARQMPASYRSVPDAKIAEPTARVKRLFHDQPAEALLTPAARRILAASGDDLVDPAERRELGTAVFLDRPLGAAGGKPDGQADSTPLLSYEAFSRRLAIRRLQELCDAGFIESASIDIEIPQPAGLAVASLPGHARKGVVALEDAKKVALDFVFIRTTRSSLDELIAQYDWSALDAADPETCQWLTAARGVLLIRTGRSQMTAFDSQRHRRFTLKLPEPGRFIECGGIEYADDLSLVLENSTSLPIPPRFDG
ncbi:MAG: hypothetical protein ABIP55_03025, partial [Tepidisphaeraceae bacterium]